MSTSHNTPTTETKSIDIASSSLAQALVSVTTGKTTVNSSAANNHKSIKNVKMETKTPQNTEKVKPNILMKAKDVTALTSILSTQTTSPVTMVINEQPGDIIEVKRGPNGDINTCSIKVVPSINQFQLSPTFEDKLTKSTGIIENLDRFCAVADIVTPSGDGSNDDESDIDIDIENDDDTFENPILKNRSASPNSVYEKLLREANIRKRRSSSTYNRSVLNVKEEQAMTEEITASTSYNMPEISSQSVETEGDLSCFVKQECETDSIDNVADTVEVKQEETESQSLESECKGEEQIEMEKKIGTFCLINVHHNPTMINLIASNSFLSYLCKTIFVMFKILTKISKT